METKCGGVYVKHSLPCPKDVEIERLKAMVSSYEETGTVVNTELIRVRAEVERLAGENAKYKAALERVASGITGTEPFPFRNLDRTGMKTIAAEAVRG